MEGESELRRLFLDLEYNGYTEGFSLSNIKSNGKTEDRQLLIFKNHLIDFESYFDGCNIGKYELQRVIRFNVKNAGRLEIKIISGASMEDRVDPINKAKIVVVDCGIDEGRVGLGAAWIEDDEHLLLSLNVPSRVFDGILLGQKSGGRKTTAEINLESSRYEKYSYGEDVFLLKNRSYQAELAGISIIENVTLDDAEDEYYTQQVLPDDTSLYPNENVIIKRVLLRQLIVLDQLKRYLLFISLALLAVISILLI